MKSKTPVVVALVLIVAVVAFVISSDFSSQETATPKKNIQKGIAGVDYDSFTIIMNRLVGEGNWSAKGHKVGADSTLTVTDLNFSFDQAGGAGEEKGAKDDKAMAGQAKDKPVGLYETIPISLVGNVATVEIKKGVAKKDLEATLASPDWINKKALHLSEGVTFKDFSLKYSVSFGGLDDLTTQMDAENMSLEGLRLGASDATAPAGPAGFLKALHLDSFSHKNVSVSAEDMGLNYKIGMFEIIDFGFAGQPLAGLESVDPSGLASVLSAFSAKGWSMKDFNLALKCPIKGEKGEVLISVASLEEKDIQYGKIGESKTLGAKLELRNFDLGTNEDIQPIIFSVDQFSFAGFDVRDYLNKVIPSLIALVAAIETENIRGMLEGLGNSITLSDLLFGVYSLDSLTIKGAEFKLGSQVSVALAEISSKIPFKAGTIPASSLNTLEGLVITLNDDKSKAVGDFSVAIYEFGQYFGQNRFEIDSEIVGKHDPKTGIFSFKGTKMTVKDLFDLDLNMEISGLTDKQLKTLSEMPLTVAVMTVALVSPVPVFGDMALDNFSFKFTDQGLTDRIFKFAQAIFNKKSPDRKSSAKALREQFGVEMTSDINVSARPFLPNVEVLTKALATFFTKPQSLELSLKPTPPLNTKYLLDTIVEEDINGLLNSLNLTIKANGQDSPALKFSIPSGL